MQSAAGVIACNSKSAVCSGHILIAIARSSWKQVCQTVTDIDISGNELGVAGATALCDALALHWEVHAQTGFMAQANRNVVQRECMCH